MDNDGYEPRHTWAPSGLISLLGSSHFFLSSGGGGGILPEHPKKFSVAMVKRKFFVVNEQIVEKRFASVIGKSEV
jgi:hypothetical protein